MSFDQQNLTKDGSKLNERPVLHVRFILWLACDWFTFSPKRATFTDILYVPLGLDSELFVIFPLPIIGDPWSWRGSPVLVVFVVVFAHALALEFGLFGLRVLGIELQRGNPENTHSQACVPWIHCQKLKEKRNLKPQPTHPIISYPYEPKNPQYWCAERVSPGFGFRIRVIKI